MSSESSLPARATLRVGNWPVLWARVRFQVGVLLLYAVVTLYLLANVLPHFGSAIPGSGVALADGWQNTWNLWWTRRAIASGQNPYWTPLIFYPTGASLYLHTLNITNALITMPVQLIGGPVAAYNTAVFLGLVLTGFATYLLALRLIGHPIIACAVGALFTFSPFHLSKVWDGHLSWVTVYWIPFYLVALLVALDEGKPRHSIIAGVILALATLTSWYYAIFSLVFTLLLAAVRASRAIHDGSWRRQLVTLVMVAAVTLIVSAPVVIPTIREYLTAELPPPRYEPDTQMPGWDGETGVYSADLLDIFFPSFLHPLWGDWSRDLHAEMRQVWFWTISPGFGALVLALVGSVYYWRKAWPWVVLVVVLFMLMLGPHLRIAGVHTSVPLPHELLRFVPGMTLAHRPNHFAIYMLPFLMVLAGFGMLRLWNGGRWARGALAALAVLVVVEYAVLPFPTLPTQVHREIATLTGQPGAVLDLPPDERMSGPMNNQMVHGRPIVGGYLARQFDVPPFVKTLPWLRQLWQLYPDKDYDRDIIAVHPDDGQQAFRFYNITTILVRRSELEPFQDRDATRVIDAMLPGITPSYSDSELSIYQIPPVAQPEPLIFLGNGWLQREYSGERSWRWMGEKATLRLINPDTRARWGRLELHLESYETARPLTVTLGTASLGTFMIKPGSQVLNLQFVLPPGEQTLTLVSTPTREESSARRWLSLSFSRIELKQ